MTKPLTHPTPALWVQGLTKNYPHNSLLRRGLQAIPAVHQVDLRILPGEVVGIIGESGSGKTTLVRCAMGLLPFQDGRVTVFGQDITSLSKNALRRLRTEFQLLFQDPSAMLNPAMTVSEHLLESALVHGVANPDSVCETLIQQMGLTHRVNALPHQLSGGEKRRVGLARVLVPAPRLLVADEPTAGLDAGLKADLIDLIVAHRTPQTAVVLISHDLPMVAYAADRIVVMLEGQIVDRFDAHKMGTVPHHPYTTELLKTAGILGDANAPECARGEE